MKKSTVLSFPHIVSQNFFDHLSDKSGNQESEMLWDLASLTKFYATALAAMHLYQLGKFKLDRKVSHYISSFKKDGFTDIRLHHLLSHRSGLTAWLPLYLLEREKKDYWHIVSKYALEGNAGEKRLYSDLNYQILPQIIELIAEESFDIFCHKKLYEKMELERTIFKPLQNGFPKDKIVPSAKDQKAEKKILDSHSFSFAPDFKASDFPGWREEQIQGEVNDGNSFYYFKGVSGHAGLFSSLKDLRKIHSHLFQQNRGAFFNDKAKSAFFPNKGISLGLPRCSEIEMEKFGKSFGHFGFTGNFMALDLASKKEFLFLSSRLLQENPQRTSEYVQRLIL